ncbi:N-6 DNA methylase [Lusitaniella coriacea LEGE 07157]|uniref:site-specific DNA-methyltransferase (adenine-specific) n=1 Tax=Lusitaniella coriacea LEGE 07157 TaxID=945747 RepID=A0A8J7JC71_9CYAN|nr:N-6 DNA methylase [Lusitaniella coriacea]MBE9117240.1 N-6 DNA methylase [Lusitaniella coriacea LEGE 07157]
MTTPLPSVIRLNVELGEKVLNEKLQRDFRQRFDKLCHRRSDSTVFQDWVEVAAICLHQTPCNQGILPKDAKYEELEARYMEFVLKYKREGLTVFSEMLGIVQMALSETHSDFLGELYEALELTGSSEKQRRGEFFTPHHLSTLMAKMSLDKEFIGQAIAEKGHLSLCEPACGFGGMVIETCKHIEALGFEPSQMVFVEATDISRTCFHATYLQLSLLGIPARVRHGNTLSDEMWEVWATPILQLRLRKGEIDPRLRRIAEMAEGMAEEEPEVETVAQELCLPEKKVESAETYQLELFSDGEGEEPRL